MHVTAVESTTLATIVYDELRELLRLEFCSQAIYLYWGVPPIVHQGLLDASSKGRYFNQAIRGRFPFQRVSPGSAAGAEALSAAER
jgi:hypothetical protein